jgi:hypothetical protein
MPKRRILVVSEESVTSSNVKNQKKIAVSLPSHGFILSSKSHTWSQVSIDTDATNDDLAKEIANYLDRGLNTFTLELPGGFELRGQE